VLISKNKLIVILATSLH